MLGILVRAVFAALGLWLAAEIVPGVSVDGTRTLVLAALLLALVNAVLRPVLFVLTLPITFITLGLFLLVLNAAMIGLVAWLLDGFRVDGLLAGVLAAVVTGLVGWVGQMLVKDEGRRR